MSLGLLIQIARVFSVLSLVSIGGVNAVLPEIRRQIVDVQGWMNDATFANLFAISPPGSRRSLSLIARP